MEDYDFDPPSFSLGIDLDLQSESQTAPPPDPVPHPAKRPSTASNLRTIEEDDDDDFASPVRVSAPPRVLKRLRLGPKAQSPPPPPPECPKVEHVDRRCNVDDEIEGFSSDEDCPRGGSLPSNSVCSSSKPSLHGKKVVTSESGIRFNTRKGNEVPSASASINVETRGSNVIFPKLTVSPLRRFQLIDSDSDDPSTMEDKREEMPSAISSEDIKSDYCKQAVIGNHGIKTSVGTHQIKDLWKNFCPEKSNRIPTPAFDEFCEEYFTGLKDTSMPKLGHKDTGCGRKTDETSVPPAHCYFFHNDSRIQKLVRERLPHFFPLEVGNNQEYKQQNVSVIDYMGQFGGDQNPGQTSRRKNVEKSSTRSKKNTKNSQVDSISEESGQWVTPKSSAGLQKNAGSRRVQAVSGGSGHWYTGQDGRRVYVTKSGQELSGQIAYRHYKKESGKGVRNSKKKTTAKKKTASKKSGPKK